MSVNDILDYQSFSSGKSAKEKEDGIESFLCRNDRQGKSVSINSDEDKKNIVEIYDSALYSLQQWR